MVWRSLSSVQYMPEAQPAYANPVASGQIAARVCCLSCLHAPLQGANETLHAMLFMPLARMQRRVQETLFVVTGVNPNPSLQLGYRQAKQWVTRGFISCYLPISDSVIFCFQTNLTQLL